MKTKTWIAILAAVFGLCLGLSLYLARPSEPAAFAEISSQGRVIATVALSEDQTFTVTTEDGGRNVVTVLDGKIAVTEANCPDGYCMERGVCGGGMQIVCLPNRLTIRFLGHSTVDGVSG